MVRNCAVLIATVLLVASPQFGHAADTGGVHPYLSDKFFVDIGVFLPDRRLGLAVDGSNSQAHDPIEF